MESIKQTKSTSKSIPKKNIKRNAKVVEKSDASIFSILTKIFFIVLVLFMGSIVVFVVSSVANYNKFLKNISLNGVYLGELTYTEATAKMQAYEKELNNKIFVLKYEEYSLETTGEDLGIRYEDQKIDQLYKYGKEQNVINNYTNYYSTLFGTEINEYAQVSVKEDKLNDVLAELLGSSSYIKEDAQFEYDKDNEIIYIKKGHRGIVFDTLKAKKDIEEAASDNTTLKHSIYLSANDDESKEIDFDELYDLVYVEKEDAAFFKDAEGKYVYKPEVIGKSFDKDVEYYKYKSLDEDEEMKIEVVSSTPKITTQNLDAELFPDKLGTYTTYYNAKNINRSTNLNLAAKYMNGTILLPDEVFSYNKAVGERTVERGFKEAHVYQGGNVVDGLGGGICQISSTLYNAVLKANLEIVLRKNHMMWPEYVEPSFDATVVYGSIDFKFKNNRETPIKVIASATNGVATVSIYGKKSDNDPVVTLQSVKLETYEPKTIEKNDPTLEVGKTEVTQTPVKGYKSEGYKILKYPDGTTEKIKISTDTYKATNKIVSIGTKKVSDSSSTASASGEGINSEVTTN